MKHHYHHHIHEHPALKFTPQPTSTRKLVFLILFFITLTTLPLYLRRISPELGDGESRSCDLFNGTWVPHSGEPYYTNDTCGLILDQQNCMKFGRPDSDYLRWRWKPDRCEIPLFDALDFLELVRGKSLAFLGDSVGKNQMNSLLCLLSNVSDPEDVSEKYSKNTTYFRRYLYNDYNFTVGTLWAPFLVRSEESDPNGYSRNSLMNLYLDEPNEGWFADVAAFDYVVVSAGQWFFRPAMLYENRTLVGCANCGRDIGVPNVTPFELYQKAFRTVFNTLVGLPDYKGVTFLRTFSPSHFENGEWNNGGSCPRTQPFGRDVEVAWYIGEMRRRQVDEFRAAKKTGSKKGLEFRLLDTTRAMYMRPDGHPNFYGHSVHRNMSVADCVHWCLPGPIDTWNEMLLYILRTLSPNNSTAL